ncbi:SCE4755 family polysaccharide monooxygenase-like protein, partial [Kaarinaea lacus]
MLGWKKIFAVAQLIVLMLIAILYTEMASAHARFVVDSATPPRSDNAGIKTGPCGGYPPSQDPVVFTPGQQITVEWEETINHPGYYRIAFSPAGDQGYDENVLYQVDDDQDGSDVPHFYSATITLPDIECEDCSLQLIQYMTERDPPSLYYSCADIRLVADGPPPDVQNPLIASGNNEISISWQFPNTSDLQVLVLQDTSPITGTPITGLAYTSGDTVDTASVLYAGNASQVIANNLSPNQTYYFKIFVVDSAYRYSTGIELQQTVAQELNDTEPPLSVQNFTASLVDNSVELNWENPVDDFYKVLILWDTNPIIINPIDSNRYDAGDLIGTARVVFNGLGNAATVVDLLSARTHYFKIYTHDSSFNYSQGIESSVFLPADGVNQKPQLSLAVSQNGSPVTTVYQDKGLVTISVIIQDDSDVSQATISWGGTDTRLV